MSNKVLFKITNKDVQNIALRKIGRKLKSDELYQVQRGLEFGLEYSWDVVVNTAIDDIQTKN